MAKFTEDDLNRIFDKTSGYCHICRKELSFRNYGCFGDRGAWEVEHSRARAKGETDHLNNLYAACIQCNRSKGAGNSLTARRKFGHTKAPLSVQKREKAKKREALETGVAGSILGGILGGPIGAIAGLFFGASSGHNRNPDKKR